MEITKQGEWSELRAKNNRIQPRPNRRQHSAEVVHVSCELLDALAPKARNAQHSADEDANNAMRDGSDPHRRERGAHFLVILRSILLRPHVRHTSRIAASRDGGGVASNTRHADERPNAAPLRFSERTHYVRVRHFNVARHRAHSESSAACVRLRVLVKREQVVTNAGDVVERK